MSETISQLPQTNTRTSQTDLIPVTVGYGGSPGTGITYGKPVADILSAAGLIYAADPIFGGGVKADGVSDDTTPWTIVMQAAQNTGAWVVAPPGVSLVSAFTVPDGTAIIGRNAGSYSATVGFPNLGTVIQGSSVSNPTIALGQFCQLHNIQVVGTSAQPCVQATKGYIDLFDCTMLNGSVGVDFLNVGGPSTLLGLRIHDCPTAGIRGAHHVGIGGCTITSCGSGVVMTNGCNGVRLSLCRIEFATNYGITADGTGGTLRDLIVNGCSIDASGKSDIVLRAVSNSSVAGNSIARGGQSQGANSGNADDCDLYMQNCNGVIVTGNTSRTGLNDAGSGYNSPYWAIFDGGGNTNCQIAANVWAFHNNSSSGATGGPINSTATFNLASTLNVTFWS